MSDAKQAAERAYLLSVVQQLMQTAREALVYYEGRRAGAPPKLPLHMAKALLRDLDPERIAKMSGSILDVAAQVQETQRAGLLAQIEQLERSLREAQQPDVLLELLSQEADSVVWHEPNQLGKSSREVRQELLMGTDAGVRYLREVLRAGYWEVRRNTK